MSNSQAIETFTRGTAVKITDVLDINTATSATITIDNPNNTEVVSNANMTKEADKVYSYTWQSSVSNPEGEYVVTFKITYAGKTSVRQSRFLLVKQEGSE